MNQYLSSASLKSLAKGQLLGKYGTVIGALLLHILCTSPLSLAVSFLFSPDTLPKIILYSLFTLAISVFAGFFTAGEAYLYLKLACNQYPQVSDLLYCFKNEPAKVFCIQAVFAAVSLICSLPSLIAGNLVSASLAENSTASLTAGVPPVSGSLFLIYTLLLVGGMLIEIVFGLFFSQIFYLMLDFPQYSAKELFRMCYKLMKGNIARLFYLQISFLPLILLSLFSFGIALLWIKPYMNAAYANFYLDLINKRRKSL